MNSEALTNPSGNCSEPLIIQSGNCPLPLIIPLGNWPEPLIVPAGNPSVISLPASKVILPTIDKLEPFQLNLSPSENILDEPDAK